MLITQGVFNKCLPPTSTPFFPALSSNCWKPHWLLFHLVKITWEAWSWYIRMPLTSTEPPTEILMVTDPEAESASAALTLPTKGQVFSGDCTTLMKKKKNSTGTSSTERTFHMLSQSLESRCIIAFNIAGDAIEISQRLLSQMWVHVKVIVDTSLSLIELSITSIIRTLGSVGKRKAEGQHTMVMWGVGSGEGRRALTERQMDRAGRLKCLFLPFHFSGFLYSSVLWTLSKYTTAMCVCVPSSLDENTRQKWVLKGKANIGNGIKIRFLKLLYFISFV